MRELVESHELRHFSIRALAIHAQRIGALFASESTWWRTIREKGWIRARTPVHPESPRIGIRASAAGELLHVDVTVIRLLDGTKIFLQAVLDNFSRRILSWRISPALEPWRTGELLKSAIAELRSVGDCGTKLLVDSGVENVNEVVDEALKEANVERILAQVEVAWSNSMIEAIWRKLKHDWLFLNRLDSFAAVERLVAFYIEQYNTVLPHSAIKGRTPDEAFRGEAIDLPERLREAHRAALQQRITINRRLSCDDCQVATRAREGSQVLAESTRKVE
jgi:transposase InsO family protein